MTAGNRYFLIILFASAAFLVFHFGAGKIFSPVEYLAGGSVFFQKEEPKIFHIETPPQVRAIYMTSWVAGTKNWRSSLMEMVDETELNSIIIDVKDYTGRIAFETKDPVLQSIGASENRIPDIEEFIKELHQKNIYVIGRISVFQDPYLAKNRPDLAVKTKSGEVWKDKKGLSWVEPASPEVWDYVVRIARAAEKAGFDELNFDYVRFPSDGNMQNINYSHFDGSKPMAEIIRDFFFYLHSRLSSGSEPAGIPLSVDLFGLVTWNEDDLNIGQILEYAEPYFDYIMPMVYPSHYPPTFNGYKNPAEHPYEIIFQAMERASQRLIAASSSPNKLRPWLQDFDLGAVYDASMVRKEKQAVYDAGLSSWALWDPANRYTRGALDN